jgi:UDP-glucose 4-epimerase
MKTVLVTGGAGFIGSHLAGCLLERGRKVICVDNLTLGSRKNIKNCLEHKHFSFYESDVSDTKALLHIVENSEDNAAIDMIFHLAANSDIQKSSMNPGIEYENTFQTTWSVLELMRIKNIQRLFFASTSAVYGEQPGVNLSEDSGALFPISYYGGAKLASEAFLSAYSYMNNFDITVFRFPNVIGPGLTHGALYDFIKKLQADTTKLEILGDGTQRKPYIYIDDLLEVILLVSFSGEKGMNVYNIGVEGATSVREIADMVCASMGLQNVRYTYTGGSRGWKGDVPAFQYDLTKIHKRGWTAKYNSNQAVRAALEKYKGLPRG